MARRILSLLLLIPLPLLLNGCLLFTAKYRDQNTLLRAKVDQLQQDLDAERGRAEALEKDRSALMEAVQQGQTSTSRLAQQVEKGTEAERERLKQLQADAEARLQRENEMRRELERLGAEAEAAQNEQLLLESQLEQAREQVRSLEGTVKTLEAEREEAMQIGNELLAERDDARAERDDFRRQMQSLTSTTEEKDRRVEELSSELRDREKELAAARRSVEELEGQAKAALDARAKASEANAGLRRELASAVGGVSNAQVLEDPRGIVVRLRSDALFQPGTVILSEPGSDALRRFARAVKDVPMSRIVIEGHTDNTPVRNMPFVDNWDLAAARASTVVRFLASEGGIPAAKLNATSHAFYAPVAANETTEGRAQNRRVDIVLEP